MYRSAGMNLCPMVLIVQQFKAIGKQLIYVGKYHLRFRYRHMQLPQVWPFEVTGAVPRALLAMNA